MDKKSINFSFPSDDFFSRPNKGIVFSRGVSELYNVLHKQKDSPLGSSCFRSSS